ncbi:MAG: hypothetical protein LLG97_13365 [Deltaproteobacteria bacterium]|nr:hypothetical protein [Deltaproteobacteria bacterium]
MKRMTIAAMALVMLFVSIGGCWPWWYEDGRGHDRGHDKGDRGHEEHHGHEGRR